ncbi:IS3 family transposase [Paenibacillus ginsengarvi]|uniref:HTH-like domain-containing protein n=1 Tax=Paenibacillus ginsengarvi TaxID=400777 RepID=A0A3B0CP94_9BACL|nr:IS3 family transposase [Paenibacillus ginsengarvi]RKN85586.1 hypothetical protein D7M11_07830 [Paenibacillus ginsengarvi]
MGEQRRRYNEEFKQQTVKYMQDQVKSLPEIADELNIPLNTLYQWKAKYRKFENKSVPGAERIRELEQLLKEKELEVTAKDQQLAEVEEQLAIVKKDSAHLQQTKEVRFQFIEAHRSEFRVEKMCEVFAVSRSGYYKWIQSKANENSYKKRRALLLARITRLFLDSNKRYGSPRLTKLLQQEGWTVSERLVGKLMRESGLHSSLKNRVTATDSNHDRPAPPTC